MASMNQIGGIYEFGPFRLDPAEKTLWRDGQPVPLTPKAFDTLLILVERSGRLVEKDELIRQLWPDSVVEENSLPQNIYLLRKALEKDVQGTRYIETVPRRGYRFIALARKARADADELAVDLKSLSESSMSPLESEQPTLPYITRPHGKRVFSLIALFSLLAITLAADWIFRGVTRQSSAPHAVQKIAVLPFKPLATKSPDEQRQIHLGLGLSDALIAKFSRLHPLSVRPTSAVLKYAGQSYNPATVGGELGVDAVLEGTVQQSDGRVRVIVQLINVRDGQSLWAERFDEPFTNVFSVQDAISEKVAQALKLKLTGDERRRLAQRHTENPEAYQDYARGLFFWGKRTEDGLTRSITYFKQAVEKDSRYALAWAGLADAYAVSAYLGYQTLPEQEAYRQAQAAALKALELNDTVAEAHAALSVVKAYRDYDLRGAEAAARQAVALQPNSATAHQRLSIFLRDQGRLEEALTAVRRGQELDPLSLTIGSNLAYILYLRRDYEAAIAQCRKVLETEPDYFQTLIALGMAYEQQQKYDDAIATLGKVREQNRGRNGVSLYLNALETLGHAYAAAGRQAEAAQILDELSSLQAQAGDKEYHSALIRAGLGETSQAFALLERSSKGWRTPPVVLMLDPRFQRLRADARYQHLFKKRVTSILPAS